MSEPMCVCGHGAEEHTMIVQNIEGVTRELGRQWCKRDCLCEEYRPCPLWPDAECWLVRESDGEHVKAVHYSYRPTKFMIRCGDGFLLENEHGPDRFCLAPNPFAKVRER